MQLSVCRAVNRGIFPAGFQVGSDVPVECASGDRGFALDRFCQLAVPANLLGSQNKLEK